MIGWGSPKVMMRINTSKDINMRDPKRARYSLQKSLPMKGTRAMLRLVRQGKDSALIDGGVQAQDSIRTSNAISKEATSSSISVANAL